MFQINVKKCKQKYSPFQRAELFCDFSYVQALVVEILGTNNRSNEYFHSWNPKFYLYWFVRMGTGFRPLKKKTKTGNKAGAFFWLFKFIYSAQTYRCAGQWTTGFKNSETESIFHTGYWN